MDFKSIIQFIANLFSSGSNQSKEQSERPANTLLQLSPVDFWTVKDSQEGTLIIGATGSGKTSGSGKAIARSFLKSGMGGLILTVKVDETEFWKDLCRETGREQDLVIFNPMNPYRFNFMEYEQSREGAGAGITENLAKLFTTVMEISNKKSRGNSDEYWTNTLKQLLRNTIDLLQLAGEPVNVQSIYEIITSAPNNAYEAKSTDWVKESYCGMALAAAQDKNGENNDYRVTALYWLQEYPNLSERTRSIIVSSFTSLADGFLKGHLRELFCTTTNISPDDCWRNNKILVIDLNIKEYSELGQQAQVLFKYVFQKAVERRDIKQYPNAVFLWADEAQFFFS